MQLNGFPLPFFFSLKKKYPLATSSMYAMAGQLALLAQQQQTSAMEHLGLAEARTPRGRREDKTGQTSPIVSLDRAQTPEVLPHPQNNHLTE